MRLLVSKATRALLSRPRLTEPSEGFDRDDLALTETHRRLYPRGILAQEREVVAIEALARLGKARAAEQRASGFRNEQPHSIHESRLRGVLGDAGVETRP
jgi:hypothetical protein